VCTGRAGLFENLPCDKSNGTLTKEATDEKSNETWDNEDEAWGASIYRYTHGWLIDCNAFMQGRAHEYAISLNDGELIYWSEFDWGWVARARPQMAAAILKDTFAAREPPCNFGWQRK